MLRLSWLDSLQDQLADAVAELKTFLFLFQREKVFRYFLVLLLLMLFSGTAFLMLEYPRITALPAEPGQDGPASRWISAMYWAMVTISTCGYGDLTPGTPAGRLLAIVVLLTSVAAVSMFTANLASALTTKKLMERRGVMDLSDFRNHYILCGWKQAMDKLLDEIVYNNPRLDLKKIIVLADVEPEDIEVFRQQYPAYHKINLLRGEHYQEAMLSRVNVTAAAQVFILADESSPTASRTEIDSKTVMTAMAIRNLSAEVRICAELLDAKFKKYLQAAHVDDIIFTSEYSKVLVASSFSQVGIAKVVNDLLNAHTPAFLVTEHIPQPLIGRPFSDLGDHFRRSSGAILIGLVENVGSIQARKQEAIREAQKTADIGKLVENLRGAKKLEHNRPYILPENEYPVPPNALAVLVQRRKA